MEKLFESFCIDKNGRINPRKVVQLLAETQNFANNDGHLYHYEEKMGAWVDITNDIPNKSIYRYIPDNFKYDIDSVLIRRLVNDLISNIKLFKEFENHPSLLNVKNGVVDLENLKIKGHDRSLGFRYMRNFDFTGKAETSESYIKNAENFCKYLCSSLGCDSAESVEATQLLEMVGYVISERRDAEQSFYLLGDSNVGKSLILKLLEDAFNEGEISSIGLHELGSSFRFAELAKGKVNLLHELKPVCIKCVDTLKKVISCEPVIAEAKGKAPIRVTPKTVFVSATNTMPQFAATELNNSLVNRMTVLRFLGKIDKEAVNRNLLEELKQEKNIIFTVALNSLKKVITRNMQFTQPQKTKLFMDAYAKSLNSIQLFVDECCDLGAEQKVFSKTLYALYHNFAKQNMLFLHTAETFGVIIRSLPSIENKKIRIADKSLQGYKGIGLKVDVINKDQVTGV